MTQDTRELVELAKAAVEFANLAAGESLSIDGIYPEDFLMRYSDATGFEDWYNFGQHAADALTAQAERIETLEKERNALRLLVEELERVLPADRRSYRALRARVAAARAALAGKGEA